MSRNNVFLLVLVVFCVMFFVGCGQVEFERGLAGLTIGESVVIDGLNRKGARSGTIVMEKGKGESR